MRLFAAESSLRQKSRSRFISAISAGVLDCMLLSTKYSFVLIIFTVFPFLLLPGEMLGLFSPLPAAACSRMEATLLLRARGGALLGPGCVDEEGERKDDTERRADTGRLNGREVGLRVRGDGARGGTFACCPFTDAPPKPPPVELVLNFRVRAGEGVRLGRRGDGARCGLPAACDMPRSLSSV